MQRRGNWASGFSERFGKFDVKLKQALTNRHTIWLHAVSVGEVNICTQLIRSIEPRLPNIKIVVSTTTTTGMGELQKKLPSHISKIYYPVDTKAAVRKALATISPRAVVLVEAEIWPNFLWRAKDAGIPVFLVNARLSDRSYKGYKRFGFLFRKLFEGFAGVGAQNEADAVRLRELGFRSEAIRIVGSLKFDAAKLNERHLTDVPSLLAKLNVPQGAPVLLGGSTHDGEEEVLGRIYLKLRAKFPGLLLVLVPRHFERSRDVARKLEALGISYVYRKEVVKHTGDRPDCLLVNTTGELRYFYEHASVVFVGKSLTAHGGQNPIEPGALAKPMVFGPNMENFAEIAAGFLKAKGAVQVKNEAELLSAIDSLLADPERRQELGVNALAVVRENLGAVDRTVDMIVEQLDDGITYVVPRAQVVAT